jgi:hypothetical protein
MNKTVIGAFENNSEALQAKQELLAAGFSERSIVMHPSVEPDSDDSIPDDNPGFMQAIRSLFSWDLDDYRDENYGDHYVEAARRGHAILTIDVDESEVEMASDLMDSAGALDINEKVSEWRSQGYGSARQEDIGERASATNTGVSGAATAAVAANRADSGLGRTTDAGTAGGTSSAGQSSLGTRTDSGLSSADLHQGATPGYRDQGVKAAPTSRHNVHIVSRSDQGSRGAPNP